MAIKKQVTADNGIITEYHRIALLSIDTNNQNTILIQSYLSEAGRQIEKDYAAGKYRDVDIGMMAVSHMSRPDISVSIMIRI